MIQPEDEFEKYDRLQTEKALENPEAAAFYNAKLRTERRVSRHLASLEIPNFPLNARKVWNFEAIIGGVT